MTTDPFAEPLPSDDDPFALPLYDVTTGEVEDDEPAAPAPAAPVGPAELVVAAVADALTAADDHRFLAALRDGLARRLDHDLAMIAVYRPGGKVTEAVVAPEVRYLAAAESRLSAIAGTFTEAARYAKGALADLVVEVRHRDVASSGGTTSIKVGDPAGPGIKVSVTQPTKATVDEAAVLDVIVGVAVQQGLQAAVESGAKATSPAVVAQIARDALDRYRSLVSPPAWKSTALDVLRRGLEAAGDAAAVKLAAAVGRTPHGNPTTKVEWIDE